MAKRCQITGKGRFKGNNVSHANNKTIKISQANLHWKRVFDSTTGKWVRIKVSARALRTINKNGLKAVLKSLT
ncbi:MAG TPA: 50S ribosomal protein L28 [Oligoflexia bacterium]|nr:50S ribosomal protein L28 [Oligoflexia bacterium]HMP48910.1 50S ribosomal protein L28 [Oligoflexia bacterium]